MDNDVWLTTTTDSTTWLAEVIPKMNDNPETWQKIVILVATTIAVGIYIGNFLTLAAFIRCKILQTPAHFLICNQSVADIFSATALLVYCGVNYDEYFGQLVSGAKYVCLVYLWMNGTSYIASFTNIFGLSVERTVAIVFPITNLSPKKPKFVIGWIVLSWLGILAITLLPALGLNRWSKEIPCRANAVYNPQYFVFVILGLMCVILIITAAMNIVVGVKAFRRVRKKVGATVHIDKSTKMSDSDHSVSHQPSGLSDGQSADKAIDNRNRDQPKSPNSRASLHITLMLLCVVGTFYACWTPNIILTAYSVIRTEQYRTNRSLIITHEFFNCIMVLSGFFNPLIYAQRNPHFRKAFVKLLNLERK